MYYQDQLAQDEKNIKADLLKSVFVHTGLVVLVALLGVVQKKVMDEVAKQNLILVESSVRVDVVAMPTMTLKELEALSSAPESKPVEEVKVEESPEPDTKNTFVKESKSFKDLLKNLSQKEVGTVPNKKTPTKKKDAIDDSARNELRNLVLAGNKISKGTSLTGGTLGEKTEGFKAYIQDIPGHVRPQWTLPSYLINKDLKCRIRIYINEDGKLLKAEIFESSGNNEYDERALAAVRKSSPFPAPDKEYSPGLSRGELVLGFPL